MKSDGEIHNDASRDVACSAQVRLTCKPEAMGPFSLFLQHGVVLEAVLPSGVKSLLCRQFGVAPDYVTNRINTVFLDGKPVDDVDKALVKRGSVLALSASMPGFVGAAFRRGGYYAAMRKNISYVGETVSELREKGRFTLKLFNLTSAELGPLFLAAGVRVRGEDFGRFLDDRASAFWAACRSASLDQTELDPVALRSVNWSAEPGWVLLTVSLDSVDTPD
jgi:hypothetical protein